MVHVVIVSESRFLVNRESIKSSIIKVLQQKKVRTDVEVEVNIVGDRKMKALNTTFRKIDTTTDVLSFPLEESVISERSTGGFVNSPDKVLRLGNIVVSFPQAVLEAASENLLVDDKINHLVEHGMMHLLGYHHEE